MPPLRLPKSATRTRYLGAVSLAFVALPISASSAVHGCATFAFNTLQQTMAPTFEITPIDLPVPRKARSAMPERRARSSRAAYNALKQAAHGTLPLGGKKPALGVMHGAVASRLEGLESDRYVESCVHALILGCAHLFS